MGTRVHPSPRTVHAISLSDLCVRLSTRRSIRRFIRPVCPFDPSDPYVCSIRPIHPSSLSVRSWAWFLDKVNGKTWPLAWRLVRGLPVMATSFYRTMRLWGECRPPPHHAFGGTKGRFRKEAIFCQIILGTRLTRAGHFSKS